MIEQGFSLVEVLPELRISSWSHLVRLVGGGTLYGGEGVIGPGPPVRPPGPAPISARGPLAHTRGGPDTRAGAGPSNTRPAPSTLQWE